MRLLGIGLQEINLFCGLMDIGKRLNHWIYYNCLKNLYTAAQAVYILSTKTSLDEKKEFTEAANENPQCLSVSSDTGTEKE